MHVLLASPRGFCAGVRMAVEALDYSLGVVGSPIYVFHEIVHNRHIVERFQGRGAIFTNSIEEVPEGATLLFSAHGVSPQVRTAAFNRRLRTIDATCPLVTKVHLEAVRFATRGYDIVFIGHAGHDEVEGIRGEAPGRIRIVETVEDVEKLERISDKMVYLTQTTLSLDDAARIIKSLKERFPDIQGPAKDDICYATQNRQNAVRELALRVERVIVIGSQNSSNSIRLTEAAKEQGISAELIDGLDELNLEALKGLKSVLVTAGASAPEDLVMAVINVLKEKFGARVEEIVLEDERVHFSPPKELRGLERPTHAHST
ncbi:MAG: 4-hydroxy-3-methylbut-2-enyl diphosphate reductase [Deltaproteobacteria bacterium]|nr:4-hydroxy-3-methylbut-2-enyl diphosphate reductase [Deltaproteobacteria bacterium]MBI3294233.1 4-hydroxy-3-methylbut-2-enyl diphosphate reductase [Deltaproteobacteria bacterium]